MKTLMDRLGYVFHDETLLRTALTHPSYGGDRHVPHYQRLEFLGDAVLQLAISRFLFEHYTDQEGTLSRARARLVCEESLFEASKQFGLGEYLILSPGEERTGGRERPSILADVMEAIFAAVYLDGGWDQAEALILRALEKPLRNHPVNRKVDYDYKSLLQILTQKEHGAMPTYELVERTGEQHRPTFVMRVMLDGCELARGSGHSKHAAQQEAAQAAYNQLKGSADC
ncbi:MAG: ribonuclease III [Clostridia bacterium]|nr:ribonuclease III [Clostridia bacterium]